MKKIAILTLALGVATFFSACDKETEDHSFVTYYAQLEPSGEDIVQLPIGTDYQEPGIKATEAGSDVSSNIVTTTDLNKDKTGIYTIYYSITNSDGYVANYKRTVVVVDPSLNVQQGLISIRNTRTDLTKIEYFQNIIITHMEGNNYRVDDLLGGFYCQGRGYGIDYALPGVIEVADDGTIKLVQSGTCAFGGAASSVEGTYNFEDKSFTFKTNYLGYEFISEFYN